MSIKIMANLSGNSGSGLYGRYEVKLTDWMRYVKDGGRTRLRFRVAVKISDGILFKQKKDVYVWVYERCLHIIEETDVHCSGT